MKEHLEAPKLTDDPICVLSARPTPRPTRPQSPKSYLVPKRTPLPPPSTLNDPLMLLTPSSKESKLSASLRVLESKAPPSFPKLHELNSSQKSTNEPDIEVDSDSNDEHDYLVDSLENPFKSPKLPRYNTSSFCDTSKSRTSSYPTPSFTSSRSSIFSATMPSSRDSSRHHSRESSRAASRSSSVLRSHGWRKKHAMNHSKGGDDSSRDPLNL
jgi:hypothetical protein